ncbi:MAG: hypothetical protein HC925_00100 [Coleofasciculaceae cyanobacterium SM2_3_26]|nr:hypothetical protein [Coleofasciculaceae cyanobacterium SM2_3_26]
MSGISFPDLDPYAGIGGEVTIDVPYLGDGSAGIGVRTGDRPFSDPQWNPRKPGGVLRDTANSLRDIASIDNPYDNPKNPVSITPGVGIGSRRQSDDSRDTYIRIGIDIQLGPIGFGAGIEFGLNIDFPEDPDPGEEPPAPPAPLPPPAPPDSPTVIEEVTGTFWIEGTSVGWQMINDAGVRRPEYTTLRQLYRIESSGTITYWDLGFLERRGLGDPTNSNAAYIRSLRPNAKYLLVTGYYSTSGGYGFWSENCSAYVMTEEYYDDYGRGSTELMVYPEGVHWRYQQENFFPLAAINTKAGNSGGQTSQLDSDLTLAKPRGNWLYRLSCAGNDDDDDGRDPIPPRPPKPPMRCCSSPSVEKYLKEIYEVLAPKAMKKASIPQRWIVPNAKGQIDIETYPEAIEGLYRFIDNVMGYFPITLKVSDIQNAEGGKESLHVKVHTVSDGLKQLLQLGIDTEDDVDTGNNLAARNLMENLMIHQLAVKQYALLEAIGEYIDFKRKDRSIKVNMCGDPLGAEKHSAKLDEQGEEATEDLINYLASNAKVKVSIAENDDDQTLTKRLIEINRYAATAAAAVSEPAGGGIFDKVLRAAELAVAIDSLLAKKNVQDVVDKLGKKFDDWQRDAERGYPTDVSRRAGLNLSEPYGRPSSKITEIDGKKDLNT